MTADGRIEALTSAARIDMRVVADADLAALAPWVNFDRAISGTSHGDVRLSGALSHPDAVLALNGRNVLVAGVPPTDFEAALRIAGSAATLTSLAARIAGGQSPQAGKPNWTDPARFAPGGRTWISPRSCATH